VRRFGAGTSIARSATTAAKIITLSRQPVSFAADAVPMVSVDGSVAAGVPTMPWTSPVGGDEGPLTPPTASSLPDGVALGGPLGPPTPPPGGVALGGPLGPPTPPGALSDGAWLGGADAATGVGWLVGWVVGQSTQKTFIL